MYTNKQRRDIKLQAKRNVELWIYSFADMYMILSVFFIVLSVLYAAKINKPQPVVEKMNVASAGRGPAAVSSDLQINFSNGSSFLTEETKSELQLLLPALKNVDSAGFVEVEGYADPSPVSKESGFTSNLDLSQKRAVTVAEWLIAKGVPASKIRTYSYGDGRTWSPKMIGTNKRVVVKIGSYRKSHVE
jgi:flagellar motor protein MotB